MLVEDVLEARGGASASSAPRPAQPRARDPRDLPAFRAWFEQGGLAAQDGAPLVLYHGTKSGDCLYDFVPGGVEGASLTGDAYGLGAYFASDPQEASFYAGDRGSVVPVYVRGEILDIDAMLSASQAARLTELARKYLLPSDKARFQTGRATRTFDDVQDAREFFAAQRENWVAFGDGMDRARPDADARDGKYIVEYTDYDADVQIAGPQDILALFRAVGWDRLREAGFDGLKMARDGGRCWVVMHNTQGTIKSVHGNRGTYDPHDPDIRLSMPVAEPPACVGSTARAPDWVEYLAQACTDLEAGFHFEEGGCWGMALALHEALGGELVLREGDFIHVYARVGDDLIDHQGVSQPFDAPARVLSADGLREVAAGHGVSSDELEADRDWAGHVIERARELAQEGSYSRLAERSFG